MRKPTPSTEGFTLVEVLIAAAILVVVLGIVTRGLVSYLGYTGDVQTNVGVQMQLRRTMELVTQDLRNASYGILASVPYPSGSSSVSLLQMDETSAYQVLKGSASPSEGFQNADNFQLMAPPNLGWQAGDTILLVSPQYGQGTALVLSKGPQATGQDWSVVHANQANTICWDQRMLAVKATAIGYRYDATDKLLVRGMGLSLAGSGSFSGASVVEQPVAFDVDGFTVRYLAGGISYGTLAAATAAGATIDRLAVTLVMSSRTRRRTVSRTLTSFVQLPSQFTLTQQPLTFTAAAKGSPNIKCSP